VGGVEHVTEYLAAQLAAGVEELLLMPLGSDPLTQYERLAEVKSRLLPTPAATSPGAPA
jgi:hypothetical protein